VTAPEVVATAASVGFAGVAVVTAAQGRAEWHRRRGEGEKVAVPLLVDCWLVPLMLAIAATSLPGYVFRYSAG
jgi:hypothetical protein